MSSLAAGTPARILLSDYLRFAQIRWRLILLRIPTRVHSQLHPLNSCADTQTLSIQIHEKKTGLY